MSFSTSACDEISMSLCTLVTPVKFISCFHAVDGLSPSTVAIGLGTRPDPPTITKSDEDFLKDGVEFVRDATGLNIDELNNLFVKVRTRVWFSRLKHLSSSSMNSCTHELTSYHIN